MSPAPGLSDKVQRWLTSQANFETITLFVSVMLVNLLLQDGRANYMEGVMCEYLYLIITSDGKDWEP
jgi:Ca2+/H+ antiporter